MNEQLKETSRLMREQGNRSTQYPLFVIHSLKRTYVSYSDDHEHTERNEDEDFDMMCGDCQKLYDNGEDLPDSCEHCDVSAFNYYNEAYEIDDRGGVFFTEKACKDHIEANEYHYNKPRTYVISAWRNPEIVVFMQNLLLLTGEIPSHYA